MNTEITPQEVGEAVQAVADAPPLLPGTKRPNPIELFKSLRGILSQFQVVTLAMPLALEAEGDQVKEADPELYYQIRGQLRSFIETMEKRLPSLRDALGKMK